MIFERFRKYTLVALINALCIILFTYPSIIHISDQVIGDGGDNYEYLTYQYLVHDNLEHGHLPFSHSYKILYPEGANLALTDGKIVSLFGGLLNFIFNPIISYNLTVLLILFLNGITSFIFFEELTNSSLGGVIGNIVYGYSFQRLSYGAGLINLLPIFGLMLFGYQIIKLIKTQKISWRSTIYLDIFLLLVALSSLQSFLMLWVLLILIIPGGLIYSLRVDHKLTYKKYLLHFLIGISIFISFFFATFKDWIYFSTKLGDHYYAERLNLSAYLVPNISSSTIFSTLVNQIPGFKIESSSIDSTSFLGWIELFFFLFFLLRKEKKSWDLFGIFLLVSIFIFSLGPHTLIFNKMLYKAFPFKGIFEGYRLYMIYYFLFTYFLINGIFTFIGGKKNSSNKKRTILVCLIVFLLISERISIHYFISPTYSYSYLSVVKSLPGDSILFLPLQTGFSNQNNLFMVNSNKNIIDGYTHWAANTPNRSQLIRNNILLETFYCDWRGGTKIDRKETSYKDESLEYSLLLDNLYNANIYYAVINKKILNDPLCIYPKKSIEKLINNYEGDKLYENEDGLIYKLKS